MIDDGPRLRASVCRDCHILGVAMTHYEVLGLQVLVLDGARA